LTWIQPRDVRGEIWTDLSYGFRYGSLLSGRRHHALAKVRGLRGVAGLISERQGELRQGEQRQGDQRQGEQREGKQRQGEQEAG
jgi:hypothetical protein